MADNTLLNAETVAGGDLISTDQLSDGSKVQNVKLTYGSKDQMVQINENNPLPVLATPNTDTWILVELRVISRYLQQLTNSPDQVENIRDDELNNLKI